MQAHRQLCNRAIGAAVIALFALGISLTTRASCQLTIDGNGISSTAKTPDTSHRIDPVTLLDGNLKKT